MTETKERIYLDHAATTPIRPEVLDVMLPVLRDTYGNPSSFYARGRTARHLLNDARATLARCINADPAEIFFTSCGTESDNWVIKGAAAQLPRGKSRHIVTSRIEHHAVLHPVETLAKQGWAVSWLDVDSCGLVDPDQVRAVVRPDTALVSVMMANNEIGTVQPIAKIAAICRERQVLCHSDAVQAAGAIPIDVRELGVDLLSFSGHKLYAPKGIGMLYQHKGVRIGPFMEGGAQERGQRAGTENVAEAVGFGRAFELAVMEMTEESGRQAALRDAFIARVLREIPHTRLNGHPTLRLPNNINLSFQFIEGESILLMLDQYGYECSSGSACTSGSLDPSHVLLAIGLPHEIAHGSLRVTLGRGTRQEHLDALADDLAGIVERLRAMSPLYDAYLRGEPRTEQPAACHHNPGEL